jgi:hypothetical protein
VVCVFGLVACRPADVPVPRMLTALECATLSAGIMALFSELDPTREEEVWPLLMIEWKSCELVLCRCRLVGGSHWKQFRTTFATLWKCLDPRIGDAAVCLRWVIGLFPWDVFRSLFAIRGTSDIDLCWVDPAVKEGKMKSV